MNYEDLILLLYDDQKLEEFCTKYGMIKKTLCSGCRTQMRVGTNKRSKNGLLFRCKRCKKEKNILSGQYKLFSNYNLKTIIKGIYLFFYEMDSVENLKRELLLKSENAALKIKARCRQFCVEFFLNKKKKIGGQGKQIQIDETLVFKRKNNKGRVHKPLWVVGGICENTNNFFLAIVKNRSTKEIRQVLQQNVKSGSVIKTDMWRSYKKACKSLKNTTHCTVNHKKNFVDPVSKVHTQKIEALWSVFKGWLRKRQYNKSSRKNLIMNISEFFLKQKVGSFVEFLLLIKDAKYFFSRTIFCATIVKI